VDHLKSESVGTQDQANEQQLLTELKPLAKKWAAHRGKDLALRHKTGKLLNDHLGSPEQRQKRGKGVLKKVAAELNVAVSEISRLRAFAHTFESFADFEGAHPDAKTWDAVKKVIPVVKPQRAEPKAQPSPDGAQPPKPPKAKPPKVEALTKSLTELSSRFRKVNPDLDEDKKKALAEAIRAFAKAIPDCLKIRLSVDEVSPADETLPAAAPEQKAA
jgi:hypothetical protein